MRKISELIMEEYMVLDGAMGTQLQERGLIPEDLPEEWNITHGDVVKDIHLYYLKAGAQIIETNTFGGNPIKLSVKNREDDTELLNKAGVEVAKRAMEIFKKEENTDDDERYIAGSIGPTGKIVNMDIKKEAAKDAFKIQAEILDRAGIDIFMVETMMHLDEAVGAVEGIKEISNKPVIASMVFNKTKKGEFRTLFGNRVEEAVKALLDAGAIAVGTNCGLINEYVEVIRKMRELTDVPLVMYPNAGLPRLENNRTIFDQTPEYMIKFLDDSIEAGATIIGGCCGTTPEYISLIAKRIKGKPRSIKNA